MQDEIDYLLAMDESGVIIHENDAAVLNNVAEWMDTPVGHVYGNPAWGNRFAAFRHEPPSEAVEIGIENMVVTDMPRDVVGVVVRGVRCSSSPDKIDMYHVQIDTNLGFVSKAIKAGGNL
ncbi:hypothetical protein [Aeromonas hydrophila]|uniref:hypothetical protein n=1 Tax=Aeromonas hydrophila TaxID=644 RepID=UPI003D23C38A